MLFPLHSTYKLLQLHIVLMQEQTEYVLDEEMPEAPNEEVTQAALNRWQVADRDVKCER